MSEEKPSRPPSFQLTPSQTLRPKKASDGKNDSKIDSNSNSKDVNNPNNSRNKNNNRRRKNAKNANKNNLKSPPPTGEKGGNTNAPNAANADIDNATGNEAKNQNGNNGKKLRQRQRQRQQRDNKNDGNNNNSNEKGDQHGDGNAKSDDVDANGNNNDIKGQQPATAKPKKKRRKPKKKYPWRRFIPEGTVDPITLENLDTLDYPPFALCADEPYVTVPEWPIPLESQSKNGNNRNNTKKNGATDSTPPSRPQPEDVADLNRQRLADQWGEHLLPSNEGNTTSSDADKNKKASSSTTPLSQRPLNLFDGRALAFYMVSQLQFIDPFTRRDLTRAELVNLDRYLDRYGRSGTDANGNDKNNNNRRINGKKKNQKIRVTDAYDAKGITLSSAGAAAATAQGRADIMQQMAQQLLNTLFVGQSSVSSIAPTDANTTRNESQSRRQQAEIFSLQEQYATMQRQEREIAAEGERRYERGFGTADASGFGSSNDNAYGGFMVIDDDENPEMRGHGHNDFPSLTAPTPPTNGPTPNGGAGSSSRYSTSHISGRHGGRRPVMGEESFPALPQPASEVASSATKTKKSKTLSKISGIVKKTTAQEKQKQWEAREAARRKAMMANLTFGANPFREDLAQSLLAPPATGDASAGGSATEEQMQRNRAFAEALGVKPAIQRHYASGWARPTTTEGAGDSTKHELLDELDAALYPDSLIMSAREHRMEHLLKVEKRWKRFLNDDKAASLPLNRMNRSLRKFVHEYAEFWNLKTESFDPEPNRYIHCVKLSGTRMPRPLLSDVARNWRGPSSLPLPDATRTIASVMHDHSSQQTAGQTSKSPLQAPLPRAPAQPPPLMIRSATAMSSSKGDLVALGDAAVQNSRSDGLMDKERRQLKLLPRTVPLELPPFDEQLERETAVALDLDEDLQRRQVRREEKRRRQREMEEKKKQILEDAFASDDENDRKQAASSDSEWEDNQEALYIGSDEE